jgi:adenylosuccinate synthase
MTTDYLTVGLGYGDEGKGSIVDFLARQTGAEWVGRYNGGPQAAHNVVSNGTLHTFSQFGSGTFANAKTYLDRRMLVNPLSLDVEKRVLEGKGIIRPTEKLYISPDCLVVTPMHKIIGQMKELARAKDRRGSCGMGVGEAVHDGKLLGDQMLFVRDLEHIGYADEVVARKKLDFMWRLKLDLAEQIAEQNDDSIAIQKRYQQLKDPDFCDDLLNEYGKMMKQEHFRTSSSEIMTIYHEGPRIFEGAQGALLDIDYGFHPHITKTKTTLENAEKIHREIGWTPHDVERIGVIRAYMTRHGAGPFVTEDAALGALIPDRNNPTNDWQGAFRIGWLDLVALRYAHGFVGKLDSIAITNLDQFDRLDTIKVCQSYTLNSEKVISYLGNHIRSLDDFFEYEKSAEHIIIHAIKVPVKPTPERQTQLKELLDVCTPVYDSMDFDKNKSGLLRYSNYLDLIESKNGLDLPISIVSMGPESKDKVMYHHP